MYLEHFGLCSKPFSNTPDPRFLFLSRNHREIFAHLLYGIRDRLGFIEVTGEVGTGKTTVLRTLLSQLQEDEAFRAALIFNPTLSALDLLRTLASEFGLDPCGDSSCELLCRLNAFFLEQNAAGRTLLLVIDEAQTLPPEVLEQIRLLSNLETDSSKLLQILLVGQPELGELLSRPDLRQLSQRIAVRYHLGPMDAADTEAYVRHRLKVAGGAAELFSSGALRALHRYGRGYPREINILCERALVVAFSRDAGKVTTAMVRQSRAEMARNRRRSRLRLLPLLAGLCAALLGGWLYQAAVHPPEQGPMVPGPSGAAVAFATPTVAAAVEPARILALRDLLARSRQERTARAGLDSLLGLWGEQGLDAGASLGGSRLLRELGARGYEWTRFQSEAQQVLSLGLPAILEFVLPGVEGKRYALLQAAGPEKLDLRLEDGSEYSLFPQELLRLWFGSAYVLWRNHRGIHPVETPGQRGDGVRRLQAALSELGQYSGELSGIYDRQTITAVTHFQAARGLSPDGRVGARTLLHLNRALPGDSDPRLFDEREEGP